MTRAPRWWCEAEDGRPGIGAKPPLRAIDGNITTWVITIDLPPAAYTRFVLREDSGGTVWTSHGRVWPLVEDDAA